MKNYNSKVVDFCCLNCFINDVIGTVFDSNEEYATVDIIAHGDLTQEIIREVLSIKIDEDICPFSLGIIEFNPVNYDKEYVVSINKEMEIWCEPAWRDNEYGTGYVMMGGDEVYVHEDCNYKVWNSIDSDNIKIFGFEE